MNAFTGLSGGAVARPLPHPSISVPAPVGRAADVELPPHLARHNVRAMSPRRMAALSLDLYAEGLLGYDEYALLAFQPELHPEFDSTIGAITGVRAAPDRPRDFVRLWEERLRFERAHPDTDGTRLQRIARIVGVLRRWPPPRRAAA